MGLPLTIDQLSAMVPALDARVAALEKKSAETEAALVKVLMEMAALKKLGDTLEPLITKAAPLLAGNKDAQKIFNFFGKKKG